jgi:hypothetical protein
MDNAHYRNAQMEKTPITNSRKTVIKITLENKDVACKTAS